MTTIMKVIGRKIETIIPGPAAWGGYYDYKPDTVIWMAIKVILHRNNGKS